jgi:hypothetical protein
MLDTRCTMLDEERFRVRGLSNSEFEMRISDLKTWNMEPRAWGVRIKVLG